MKYLIHKIGIPAIKWPVGACSWYFRERPHRVNGLTANYDPIKFHDLYGRRIKLNIGKLVI